MLRENVFSRVVHTISGVIRNSNLYKIPFYARINHQPHLLFFYFLLLYNQIKQV